MQYPSCLHENLTDVLFCTPCGSQLERGCPECGRQNPPGGRFCAGCGQRLIAAESTAIRRPPSPPAPTLPAFFAARRYHVKRFLGIGPHTGEALREADKFFGKTVILAARIAAQATGGEILVSSLVKELTQGTWDIRFATGRETTLNGADKDVHAAPGDVVGESMNAVTKIVR